MRIAQGRENPAGPFLSEALHLLERRRSDAEAKGRQGSTLEILMLQVLAFSAQGKGTAALPVLERALTLAEPEGCIRLFVDMLLHIDEHCELHVISLPAFVSKL